MINYKFKAQDKEETIEAMSLKKALNSFQTKTGNLKEVLVEWISRKGNPSSKLIKLPIKKGKINMDKKDIILELREILNVYQDTMTKDVEQSLKNLIDYIESYKEKPKETPQEDWVKGYNKWKKSQ